MQREFICERHGRKLRAVVTIGDFLGKKLLQGLLSFNDGISTGSRRLNSVYIDGDDLSRVEAGLRRVDPMPTWMLADVLEEVAGWDAGFTDTIRNHAQAGA